MRGTEEAVERVVGPVSETQQSCGVSGKGSVGQLQIPPLQVVSRPALQATFGHHVLSPAEDQSLAVSPNVVALQRLPKRRLTTFARRFVGKIYQAAVGAF